MSVGVYRQSTEKKRLSGSLEQRGIPSSGMPGWMLLLFGTPFAGVGVFAVLAGTKTIHVDPSSVHSPYWVLTAFGVCFCGAALMVWSMAWKQIQARRRRAATVAHHVNEPALIDYAWDPRGFEPHRWPKVARALILGMFLTVFLSMFNWWAYFNHGPIPVKIIVGIFDAVLVFMYGYVVVTIGRALKFGTSRIEFVRFPYRANEPIQVRWQTPQGISRADKGSFTLRCVEEWYEAGRGDNNRILVHEEQWNGTWELQMPEDFLPGKSMDFDFTPPARLPVTSLSASRPVFWEFEVKLSLPGFDFREKYLVPVY